jgi:heat shock protein HtpX
MRRCLWSVHRILQRAGTSQPGLNLDKPKPWSATIFHEMPRSTSFGKDTGLQIRMTFTLFLLGAIYVVLIVVLLAVGASGILVAIIAGGLAAVNLFASDKLALAAMGARVVSPQEAPQLHAMVERLCVQADLPKPKVAVANTSMPNAFALGRSPKSATVCATTGIMDLLSPAELEGVMAHELTHVANRDVLVMTLAGFFATIAAYIVQFGFFFGGSSQSDDDDGPSFMVLLLVSLAVYVVSFFLMQALSRYREFAADRGAALITGRPSALASALQKISSGMHRIPQQDLRAASELQAFFIFPTGAGKSLSNLFATHPPMEKRLERLMRLESQLQGAAA